MDALRDQFAAGRRAMIDAFADLTTLAYAHGATEDEITALHGRFFDGHVEIKDAWRVTLLLAELELSRHDAPDHRPSHTP
jgi:hypothetical protein